MKRGKLKRSSEHKQQVTSAAAFLASILNTGLDPGLWTLQPEMNGRNSKPLHFYIRSNGNQFLVLVLVFVFKFVFGSLLYIVIKRLSKN